MRIGPFHIIRDRTYSMLQERAADVLRVGHPLFSTLLHSPSNCTHLDAIIVPPDRFEDRARKTVDRILRAFCRAESQRPSENMQGSLWSDIEKRPDQSAFVEALQKGNPSEVHEYLSSFFARDLVAGLGRFDKAFLPLLHGDSPEGV
jgi:hypothetical protein